MNKEFTLLWDWVDIKGPDECWNWKRKPNRYGYGRMRFQGKMYKAHRVAYLLSAGSIPEGLLVRHSCDNRLCCNPRHLLLGTPKDNMGDRQERHRQACGERQGSSKLTEVEVRLILSSEETQAQMAIRFGVVPGAISRIRRKKCWKHITKEQQNGY